jgi:tripartite-type tricarboxylate transporter receptor subunit TctC
MQQVTPRQAIRTIKLGRRQLLLGATAALATPLVTTRAFGQQPWPSRPVRVVLPAAAGGLNDIVTRVIAQRLSDTLGHQFVVETQPGGGGNIATGAVAKAAPDGYTVLSAAPSLVINPAMFAKIPFDPFRDFAPVTLVASTAQLIAVHPSLPARNIDELVALARANPGKYAYASAGTGAYLAGENFKLAFGLDITHVPFNGGGPAMTSMLGGHTPIGFIALPTVAENVKSGKLRALAYLSAKRSSVLPDLPTMAEAGVRDQEAEVITGFVFPAGTPREIVGALHDATVKVLAMPDVKERLATLGFDPVGSTPEEFSGWIGREIEKWRKVVRAANIQVQ